jgi:hypothetical protein
MEAAEDDLVDELRALFGTIWRQADLRLTHVLWAKNRHFQAIRQSTFGSYIQQTIHPDNLGSYRFFPQRQTLVRQPWPQCRSRKFLAALRSSSLQSAAQAPYRNSRPYDDKELRLKRSSPG